MTYVEAAAAPLRKTGQIKLHGKEAFEGMRKAGRLVAECLDMLVDQVEPGVTTETHRHSWCASSPSTTARCRRR